MGTTTNAMMSALLTPSNTDFLCVFGKTERKKGEEVLIGKGVPMTWDTVNGVTVLYDERGNPWVHLGKLKFSDPTLRRGAYVPFASDGGIAIRLLFH